MSQLSSATTDFLGALQANNDRRWFEAHKAEYLAHLKRPGEAFAEALAATLEAETGEAHAWRIFRIHRDVRFSKDKTPYNTHLRISLSPEGECAEGGPVWMFGLDPDRLTLGAGIFELTKPRLETWRTRADAPDGAAIVQLFSRLVQDGVRLSEPELKRVPSPFAQDHPRGELLRRKGLTAWIDCPDPQLAFGADGPANCVAELLRLRPFVALLREL